MSAPLPPFSCTYSPNLPELLWDLKCSLAISTYQAGKVIFISASERDKLIQLPRNFEKPMGIAVDGDRLAVATQDRVITFRNAPGMAPNLPKNPGVYDALFLPRSIYFTGELDIHDLFFAHQQILAVNTQFSCLCSVGGEYSFEPQWSPPFIDTLGPHDRCHLNGIAFKNGKPAYATALGSTNMEGGWRENKLQGGVVIDIATDKILARSLPMPHSPRWYGNKLYVLLSATGALAQIDAHTGALSILKELNGFVRGMDKVDDYLFIGLSKLRETSSAFADLPIAKKSVFAGVVVIHEPTLAIVAQLKYETSVEEIYDVKILPGMLRPNILTTDKDAHRMAITTPTESYWAITTNPS